MQKRGRMTKMTGIGFLRGLRGRLMLYFLVMALVPLCAVSIISYQKARSSLESSAENMLDNISEGVMGKIDLMVGSRYDDLKTWSQIPAFSTALETRRYREADQLLHSFEKGYSSYKEIMLVNAQGEVVACSDPALPTHQGFNRNQGDQEWFKAALSGNPKVSEVGFAPTLNALAIGISSPVKNGAGKVIGALFARVPWAEVEKIVAEGKEGESGYVFLLNKEGGIIAHPKKEKLLKENLTRNDNKDLATIAEKMAKGEKGRGHYSYEGVDKLVSFQPSKGAGEFKGLGWSAASVISYREVNASVYHLRDTVLLMILAAALAIALITMAIARNIVVPLMLGVDFAKAIAEGDLTRTLEVAGTDEIGDLARALNSMAGGLRGIVGQVKGTSLQLSAAAGQISAGSDQLARAAHSQASASEETSSTMVLMAASIQSVALNADSLSGHVNDVSSSIQELGASSEQVAKSSEVMASAVAETSATIEEMIASIDRVAENTEELAASVSETSATIEQMTVSIGEVALNSQGLQQVVAETSTVIGQMTDSIRQVAGSAAEADSVAMVATKEGIAGQAAVQDALAAMQRVSGVIAKTADSIVNLGRHSEEIGNIVQVISQIADQTNLLALNAAIEAARAGDAGRGFAVVADEVRKLAERSVNATKEIGQVIKQVQADTADSVRFGELASREAQASMDLSGIAGNALTNIVRSIEQTGLLIADIAAMTERQADASKQVNGSVEKMSQSALQLANAAKEQAFGGRQIRIAVEKMNSITRDVTSATREQSQGGKQILIALESMNGVTRQVSLATREQALSARQILDAVSSMNSMTQMVANATSEQKKGGDMVVLAIENIGGLTRENLEAVVQFGVSAQDLTQQANDLTSLVGKFLVD